MAPYRGRAGRGRAQRPLVHLPPGPPDPGEAGRLDGRDGPSAARVSTEPAASDGDTLRTQMAILRRLAKYEPFNTIELRQQIAQRVIETGKYQVA